MKLAAASPNSAHMLSDSAPKLKALAVDERDCFPYFPFAAMESARGMTETNRPRPLVSGRMESKSSKRLNGKHIRFMEDAAALDDPSRGRPWLVPRPSGSSNPFRASGGIINNDRVAVPLRNMEFWDGSRCQHDTKASPSHGAEDCVHWQRNHLPVTVVDTHGCQRFNHRTTTSLAASDGTKRNQQRNMSTSLSGYYSIDGAVGTPIRSHSRAIHRSPTDHERSLSEEVQRTRAERQYRQATWGMYCRIVAYRAKHPVPTDSSSSSSRSSSSSNNNEDPHVDLRTPDHQHLSKVIGLTSASQLHGIVEQSLVRLHSYPFPDTDEDMVFQIDI